MIKNLKLTIGISLALLVVFFSFIAIRERLFPAQYRTLVINESKHQRIDPLLVAAIIYHESHFGPDKISSHGEIGLMQVRPSTLKELERIKILTAEESKNERLYNPEFNVRVGVAYFKRLITRILSINSRQLKVKKWYKNNPVIIGLHSYNAGPTFVLQELLDPSSSRTTYEAAIKEKRPSTFKYAKNIMRTYKQLKWFNFVMSYIN